MTVIWNSVQALARPYVVEYRYESDVADWWRIWTTVRNEEVAIEEAMVILGRPIGGSLGKVTSSDERIAVTQVRYMGDKS